MDPDLIRDPSAGLSRLALTQDMEAEPELTILPKAAAQFRAPS